MTTSTRSLTAVTVALVGLFIIRTATAQDIVSFEDGYLTFMNTNQALYYRVEFRPNLMGTEEWDGSYSGLRNIQTNAASVTVPVGVFYRVASSTEPLGIGTAESGDILSPKTIFVNGQEETGTMSNVGATNITPGAVPQTISEGYHNGTGEVAGDADLLTGNIKKGVVVFGVTGSLYSAATPKTGATTSWATGDDGDLEKGVAWPNPRFTDNGNGTVTDNMTGLIWLKDANAGDGTETWPDALTLCSALANGQQGLSDGSSSGDWRLPNIKELQSLIDFGQVGPALPDGHPFTDVQNSFYWSST